MGDKEIIQLEFGSKMVTLRVSEFETDVDMDEILNIDFANIIGEILTFPVVVNRIGVLRADMENEVNRKKFDLEVYKAQTMESLRKSKGKEEITEGGTKKVKNPTVQELENSILLDKGVQLRQNVLFKAQKEYSYIDSLYWAAKDKSKKLDYCSNGLKPEDFENEILTETINGVIIKVRKKLIK